ncbi:cache domain-containing sensor histidine kinase [Paenibacillus doosanensis]|uniref:cache domain-containing sensor histidine kinase n=1 Tax=Paenibacillus doosanensis TaxID=1229154 RepID=UPI00217FB3CF|nr:sensor histidine kinase [Paenibacillus doosanensis]
MRGIGKANFKLTYKNKLIIIFVLVAFLPSFLMQYVTYMNSTQAMKAKINEQVNYNLIQTNKSLDAVLTEYEDTLYQLIINDDVVKSTPKLLHGSDFDQLVASDVLQQIFAGYSNSKKGIRRITYFDNNGNVLVSYDKTTGSSWSQERDGTPFLLIMKLNDMRQNPLITVTEKAKTDGGEAYYIFHIARKLFGISSGQLERMGYIVMDLDESVLSEACTVSLPNAPTSGISSANFLMDASGNLISFPEKEKIGASFFSLLDAEHSDVSPLPEQAAVMGQPSIMNYYPNEKTGWTIVNVTSEAKMFSEMYAMQKITIWTGLAMLSVSILLIVYFSGLLTKSIRTIVSAMQQTEHGNLNVKLDDTSGDEMSIIASSYNKMMATINELMERTKQAVQKQKESDIRSLEAQINPHFLYNTLDSINWMAIEKEEHEISRMLKGLALILRYSVSSSNQMVPLARELEWLEQYLFLQKTRFSDSFQYYVHMQPGLQQAPMYKLLLQPFVENSILHGFAGRKSGSELHIRFWTEDESSLCVEIEDNGCGMDEAVVRSILLAEARDAAEASSGIGIRNVIERLQLYYGERAHCRIESVRGRGTRVNLIMPLCREGNS